MGRLEAMQLGYFCYSILLRGIGASLGLHRFPANFQLGALNMFQG